MKAMVLTGIREMKMQELPMPKNSWLRTNHNEHYICIQSVRRQNHSVEEAPESMGNGRLNIEKMATHRFTFEQTKAGFDLVSGYRDGVMKAMIDFK